MEDGEGGDESTQEEAEEGRRPLFRKSENQPSSQEVQEHMKTHIPYCSFCVHCVRGRIPTGQEEDGEDQGITRTLQSTTHSSRRTTLMIQQNRGATRSSQGLRRSMGLTLAMALLHHVLRSEKVLFLPQGSTTGSTWAPDHSMASQAYVGTPSGLSGAGRSDMRDTASPFKEELKFEIDLRAEVDILDLRPTSQQSNGWNLRDRKDQREILWRIRKKRPKLVIGCGKCILFCTVLYHEQIKRGAWFLHDLSDDVSQFSPPCMIRLECRHDVFHASGDARDRRNGERVSFLTNSSHIVRRVEGSKRREDLDSEICEGLRQRVGDVGHTSAMMHMTSGTQVRPFDLTLPSPLPKKILERQPEE